MLALDSETTGLGFKHNARPFFVTLCTDEGEQTWYEWAVDPLTRVPSIPKEDIDKIRTELAVITNWGNTTNDDEIRERHVLVGQNEKFDCTALASIGINNWPWGMSRDTLMAGHLLASNQPHNLTDMVMQYIGDDIKPLEDRLEEACQQGRRMCRSRLPDWAIAKEGRSDMPGAKSGTKGEKDKLWKYDMWLPRAIALHYGWKVPEKNCTHNWIPYVALNQKKDPSAGEQCGSCYGHRWHLLLREYSNTDSAYTMALWPIMRKKLHERGLLDIYMERMKLLPIAYKMESRGITMNKPRLRALKSEYGEDSERMGRVLVNLAEDEGHTLELPGNGVSKSLREFCFDVLKLDHIYNPKAKTSEPTLNKEAMNHYLATLPHRSVQRTFIETLLGKRKRDTQLGYIESYEKFWLPTNGKPLVSSLFGDDDNEWYEVYPSTNPTGTDTLRWTYNAPNMQQSSKQESECPKCKGDGCSKCGGTGQDMHSLRQVFGPAVGREWWSLDAKNIELRIPAYESGEQDLINLFEKAEEPPYYGSQHLLNFHTVYPDIWDDAVREVGWEKAGPHCKKKHASTWYQWCKNGAFACVPMNTEALTRIGWKTYEQLNVGDEVLGYDGGVLKWTPVLRKVLNHDSELMEIKNNHFRAITTLDHKWIGKCRVSMLVGGRYTQRLSKLDRFCESSEITTAQEITLSAVVEDERDLDITDDEAALIGFAYGDGSIVKSDKGDGPARGILKTKIGFSVKLWQSKPNGIAWVEDLLSRMKVKFKKYIRSSGMHSWVLRPETCRNIWKRANLWVTQDFEELVLKLGTSGRRAFLDGVFAAEGHTDRLGCKHYTQNEGSYAEGIKLAVYMTGHFMTYVEKKDYYGSSNTCLDIRESKPTVTGQRIVKTNLPGKHMTWCITTPLKTWVMRQDGMIMLTGNCQYNCGRATADRAFHRNGAYSKLKSRFSKLEALNQKCIQFAEDRARESPQGLGYVETIPDKSVDPKHGYPLLCSRSEYGKILTTIPLSYRVQGTAMWWTCSAMVKIEAQLAEWREQGFDCHMVMQIHDEIVVDFPCISSSGASPDKENPLTSNLWRVRRLQELMASCGDNLGIPTPAGAELHQEHWGKGITF